MKISLIEDDYDFRRDLGDLLRLRFPGVYIDNVESVSVFEDYFESFASNPPDVAILDVMIPWQSELDQPVRQPPSEFDPFRAGIRLLSQISDDPRTCRIPIIILSAALHSVLREETVLPTHVLTFAKPTSPEIIIEGIKALTFGRLKPNPLSVKSKIIDAVDAKPGWFGISFDIKKLKQIFTP